MTNEKLLKPGEPMSADTWIAAYSEAQDREIPRGIGDITIDNLTRTSNPDNQNGGYRAKPGEVIQVLAVRRQRPPMPDLKIYRVR